MLEGRIYGKTEKSPVAELAWSNTTSLSGRKQGSCLTMQATHQLADQGGLTHLPEGSCIIIIRTSPLKLSCKVRAALNRSKFKAQSRDLNRKKKMATRAGTHFGNDTSSRLKQLSARIVVVVRFPFKLLIQSSTPVSGRNTGKWLVRISYKVKWGNSLNGVTP